MTLKGVCDELTHEITQEQKALAEQLNEEKNIQLDAAEGHINEFIALRHSTLEDGLRSKFS